jgi:hypothetical protein
LDLELDYVFLFSSPDDLSLYYKIFNLIKINGYFYSLNEYNEYQSKTEFFNQMNKISKKINNEQ